MSSGMRVLIGPGIAIPEELKLNVLKELLVKSLSNDEEKYSLMDWIGSAIGIVVAGFIVFILIWPLIDPTPNKSSSLKENIHKATEK